MSLEPKANDEPPADLPGRNEPCWCGSGKKYKRCHLDADQQRLRERRSSAAPPPFTEPLPRPEERPATGFLSGRGRRKKAKARKKRKGKIVLKTPEQIEGIRRAGRLARSVLELVDERIGPGVTTGEIDAWVHRALVEAGAVPATLGYRGYTKSCCTSINEVVCHGIPGERRLAEGDIINVDVTAILDDYFGDTSRMYRIGRVSEEAERLIRVTEESLERGIAAVRPGARLGDVGHAIQEHAEAAGYSVVRQFGGHGTGLAFHEEPHVSHTGDPGTGPRLVPGMVFTIEPMLNVGTWEVEVLADGWTAVTADGGLSAQFEHTVAVSGDGVDVLTL